jgi:MtN3 and saliva related transmembrane protein
MNEIGLSLSASVIGYAAGALTTISFLPQAIKVIRTKDTSGISLVMYIVFTLGVLVWLLYGIVLGALPVILPNVITLLLSSVILFQKIKNG